MVPQTNGEYRTALVTGASSGIGRALCLYLARRKLRVFAAARREEQLRALAEEAFAQGLSIEAVKMDVAQTGATVRQLQELDDRCGGLDIVVANAGVGLDTPGKKMKWEVVEQVLQVNVMGAAATLSALTSRMVERGRGSLVGVSSIASLKGVPRSCSYSASKAFLHVFLEGLRMDLAQTGVKVSCLHPGFVKSEMTAHHQHPMPFVLETDDAAARMGKAILQGKSELYFPWQTSAAMKTARMLPDSLFRAAVNRFK